RQDLPHHVVDAGILQPDGVQHAGRRLPDPMRRIAETRLQGRALQHDRADVAVREPFDPRVFLAEAYTAGKQHDRRTKLESAKVDAEPAHRSTLLERADYRISLIIGAHAAPDSLSAGDSA